MMEVDNQLPLSNQIPEEQSPLQSEPETEVEVKPEAQDDGLDLDSIVSSLETENAETEAKEPEAPDFEKPEFTKLANDFKEMMGVDLKQAYDAYVQSTQQLQAMQAKIQEMEAQRTLADLQEVWDVTPKELDRRVNAVLKVFDKMKPEQVEKYNSREGVQQIWASIEKSKAGVTAAPSSGGKKPVTTGKRYKKSEIRDMMMNNPTLYDQNQQQISEAFRLGLVDPD
jgi:hypothetical protein